MRSWARCKRGIIPVGEYKFSSECKTNSSRDGGVVLPFKHLLSV